MIRILTSEFVLLTGLFCLLGIGLSIAVLYLSKRITQLEGVVEMLDDENIHIRKTLVVYRQAFHDLGADLVDEEHLGDIGSGSLEDGEARQEAATSEPADAGDLFPDALGAAMAGEKLTPEQEQVLKDSRGSVERLVTRDQT